MLLWARWAAYPWHIRWHTMHTTLYSKMCWLEKKRENRNFMSSCHSIKQKLLYGKRGSGISWENVSERTPTTLGGSFYVFSARWNICTTYSHSSIQWLLKVKNHKVTCCAFSLSFSISGAHSCYDIAYVVFSVAVVSIWNVYTNIFKGPKCAKKKHLIVVDLFFFSLSKRSCSSLEMFKLIWLCKIRAKQNQRNWFEHISCCKCVCMCVCSYARIEIQKTNEII